MVRAPAVGKHDIGSLTDRWRLCFSASAEPLPSRSFTVFVCSDVCPMCSPLAAMWLLSNHHPVPDRHRCYKHSSRNRFHDLFDKNRVKISLPENWVSIRDPIHAALRINQTGVNNKSTNIWLNWISFIIHSYVWPSAAFQGLPLASDWANPRPLIETTNWSCWNIPYKWDATLNKPIVN